VVAVVVLLLLDELLLDELLLDELLLDEVHFGGTPF
jgi:hypothetical protein